jgi:hypothetical protein
VCHPSTGPTTIWEEAKKERYGTAAYADTFGQTLCAPPASIVITHDAYVAPPSVQESLRILLRDASKGHLVQFCPHNNQSHITLYSPLLRMLVLEIGPTVKLSEGRRLLVHPPMPLGCLPARLLALRPPVQGRAPDR